MKINELKQNPTITQWIDIINIKPSTINSYLLGMQFYTEFTNKAPEQLLDEADAEQDKGIKARTRSVNKNLISFRSYLQSKKLAPLSVKTYLNGVKSFYRAFDIEFKPLQGGSAVVKKENQIIPKIEDIRDILKVCDPLETCLVLVGCSSGLDGYTICNLKVGDFKKGYDPSTGVTTLSLRRLKTNVDFITFLTPEASEAVKRYLDYRARTVDTTEQKRMNQLAKQKVNDDSNYLFCLRKIHDDFLKDYDEERRKITRPALMKIYRDISTKARKNTAKGQFNYIRSHNFRKFFDSTLLNNGCDFFHCEEFMGHALPGTQGHYFVPNIEELKKYYLKFVPYLTIDRAVDIVDSPEWKNLKDENQRLKALAEHYFVEGIELINAKYEIQKLKSQTITPEEKKQEIVNFVKELNPKNESEMKFKTEMEKILGITG